MSLRLEIIVAHWEVIVLLPVRIPKQVEVLKLRRMKKTTLETMKSAT